MAPLQEEGVARNAPSAGKADLLSPAAFEEVQARVSGPLEMECQGKERRCLVPRPLIQLLLDGQAIRLSVPR